MMLAKKIALAMSALLIVALTIALNRTTKVSDMDVPSFSPIKDDLLASKYAPRVVISEKYGNPVALHYRASKHDSGNTHITYHLIWDKEENNGSGWKPFLSRWIYTGGLSIQKIMFGKKDMEGVSLVVTPAGEVIQVIFETAENYSDSDFGVKHKPVVLDGKFKINLLFDVMSWNHLFRRVEQEETVSKDKILSLTPTYFTESLWQEYTMVKREEKLLSKNRAHQTYEREYVE